ncbi:2-oxoacid:acceptor oxidoreductase family protein [Calderihabitans maritimus]|uniref:Keto/oxoacid ferredoxin oxidoreductase subunit gamma n=1 Tax=Calderihabitans maritimus TaxID=1246530 RepID=A0A1Z5HU80_9FIRM|nr:2-oxoacid:acceptor oxidoreductase family protein [Calderihabitans maritimus]GAW92968.1 keto/oxoacid ferredoxin oxidoreductase subunit gamma [Calderihabitans maritimus]
MSRITKIVIAGEGGQGVQAIAEIIGEAAYEEGKQALYIPNFGVEQRGGVSVAFIQVSRQKIGSPKFDKADVVVALSDRAVRRTRQYVNSATIFVYDSSIQGVEKDLPDNAWEVVKLPALEIAKKKLNPRVFNVIILGTIIKATGVITEAKAKEALEKKLGHRFQQDPQLRVLNHKALEEGIGLVQKCFRGGTSGVGGF